MCLILFAYQVHPKYKLIVAANRDEEYKRPTHSAHYWDDHPHVLAGRDLEKMGTWMGVTTKGRFSALTNYRNPKESSEGKRSRGELVANFLINHDRAERYTKEISQRRTEYPGYNLLAGDTRNLYYYSNVNNEIQMVKPGIYGLSNHLLNTDWPKVKRGRDGLTKIIQENQGNFTEELFSLLQNSDIAPDEDLPSTGVSLEWERTLSPLFIKTESYGTRSSTVLLMTDEEVIFKERVYSVNEIGNREYQIQIT